jgi:hypothetical protein
MKIKSSRIIKIDEKELRKIIIERIEENDKMPEVKNVQFVIDDGAIDYVQVECVEDEEDI